ncbi:UNKNOWN [Stylonychia lemnae]|uniref:Uncharacterized protein n=1 Tax=Stylonychia lemnae TaxID=5949 RepID=A0A078AS83_STYLE|nr:UNKNOWN [Stylonychia lemnae]|eukprot:CDW85325.1 UNKNOWN [Stylonychia lemnae]
MTIFSKAGILAYLMIELTNVINQQSSVINSYYIRDLANEITEYEFNQGNFDVAVSLTYINDYNQTINNELHKYAYVTVSQLTFDFIVKDDGQLIWEQKEDDYELIKCPPGRFLGESKITQTLGIENQFLCPKNFTLKLQGSFSSRSAKFLRVKVNKCDQARLILSNPNEKCANKTEIDRIFENLQIFVPIINQYFDDSDHSENPIKSTIYNTFFTTYPSLSQSLDENIKQTIRQTYTISDALSNTGGFMEIIRLFAILLIGGIQSRLYYFSIIKDLLIHQENDTTQNKNVKLVNLEDKAIDAMNQAQRMESRQQSCLNITLQIGPHIGFPKYRAKPRMLKAILSIKCSNQSKQTHGLDLSKQVSKISHALLQRQTYFSQVELE